tara:strand:+ start:257 stop:1531 length:1275 start_codon:yes stop_codon:yes gene_type:complete
MKFKNKKIHVLGINSFNFEELSSSNKLLLKNIKNIAIPKSYFDQVNIWFKQLGKSEKNLFSSDSNNDLINWLKNNKSDAVLISRGDPLWFGIGRVLLDHFPKEELCFYPSNTCVQLAFKSLKKPWQNVKCISIHGRETDELIKAIKSRKYNLAIIPDPKKNNLELIRKNLLELRLDNVYEIWLCEELGFKEEKLTLLKINEEFPIELSDMYIIVLLKKDVCNHKETYPLFGINDSLFKTFDDRPNLLTKKEIRVQILADLELPEDGVIWDIGAGSGTIGLEALKLRPKLKLYSIDKRLGTKAIISENARRINVKPEQIYEKDIKEFIEINMNNNLNSPNRVVIGGCDKETKIFVIRKLSDHIVKGFVFVIPVINLGILQELKSIFKELNYDLSITFIQIYKEVSISEGARLEPNNPIFIIKAKK